ncbi:SCO family protein [Halomonas ramblicola]|uniref:SCO family protein n=1 Tax=Halomonas ramblicola TaxID=747349 RepID=UPI0025B34117|nr:SCO family protein [Halomonas ramblicola]MDN3521126.1 SCO family protein [Halomonas ramblicola]
MTHASGKPACRHLPGERGRSFAARKGLAGVAAALLVMLAVACSEAPQWQTRTLEPGFPGLDFELIVEDGETITEAQLEDAVTLLFFGYTHCPDVCPTTLARLGAALRELPEAQRDHVKVLFVSVDPERDDPQRLASYTGAFGAQFIGATAEPERLRQLASRYGSSFHHDAENEGEHYLVTHGSNVLAFDREGSARLLIRPEDGVEEIAHDLRLLLAS